MAKKLPNWETLSLAQMVGQMVVVRASGYLFDQQIRYPAWEAPNHLLQHWLADLNVGGVILLGGSAGELSARSRQLQSWAQTPLLLCADIEEGVGQRFPGAVWMPPPMAISATTQPVQYAQEMGAITAREALAIGINWLLAPVMDVNNNPDNPVINVRAFGETPEQVQELGTAFIQGAQQYPVLTTAKHFPGHGNTQTDSHLHLPTIPHTVEELERVELPPFVSAIAIGVDSVMTAHLLIPAWDTERPATLSYTILTGKLRQDLGFEGLIVTDALIMGGVANFASPEEVAVMAVEAGADILLMPKDPEATINAVVEAVETGRIPKERIIDSVRRIFQAKEKVIPVPEMDFTHELSQPSAYKTTEAILRESMQQGGNLPLEAQGKYNYILVDEILKCSEYIAPHTPAVAYACQLGYQTRLLEQSDFLRVPEEPGLLQIFMRGNPFRGRAGLTPQTKEIIQTMLRNGKVEGLIIYGSPYVSNWLQLHLPEGLPWVFSYGQMPLAQKLAFETLFPISRFANLQGGAFTT